LSRSDATASRKPRLQHCQSNGIARSHQGEEFLHGLRGKRHSRRPLAHLHDTVEVQGLGQSLEFLDGCVRLREKHYPAGTSTSTNVRLTRQKSALFQWLAVPLWFPTDKNSVPTDSRHASTVRPRRAREPPRKPLEKVLSPLGCRPTRVSHQAPPPERQRQ